MNAPRNTILQGDSLALLKTLPDGCVQTCVSSPPYWGLRDYGTAQWDGGDPECKHEKPLGTTRGGPHSTITGGQDTSAHAMQYLHVCGLCGARRIDAQIGLEPTLAEYVAKMVELFAEVRRVLRKDGTLWLNLGDSYFADSPVRSRSEDNFSRETAPKETRKSVKRQGNLKPKDLCGVPWRVAFALQDAGWWLRSDIIWAKPNPMPESVTDRPTRSHEYIFLLTKSERYYYDAEAIREEPAPQSLRRIHQPNFAQQTGGPKDYRISGINPNRSMRQTLENFAANPGRNRRSVWTVATHPFPEAHFATFPPALIEPCILAGSSPQACEHCGAPWERMTKMGDATSTGGSASGARASNMASVSPRGQKVEHAFNTGAFAAHAHHTIGWRPTCRCEGNTGAGRCLILDPFMGAGTTAIVAVKHSREYLGIELNPAYVDIANRRLARGVQMTLQEASA